MAKRGKRVRRSVGGLAGVGTAALLAERDRRRAVLEASREELRAEIREIEQAIADLGGPSDPRPSKPGRKKAGRKKKAAGVRQRGGVAGPSLAQAIADVLSGSGPLAIADLMAAVRKAGYRSPSPNFRSMVQQRLTQDGRFKRVSRGVYALK